MQTFLPYPDIKTSAQCLDYRRLGKQRLEAFIIIQILSGNAKSNAWKNHPAVLMWKNNLFALMEYYNTCIQEWVLRGYNNTMRIMLEPLMNPVIKPTWFGNQEFHASHRSNLLRKNKEFYGKYGWNEPDDLPYVWPVRRVNNEYLEIN